MLVIVIPAVARLMVTPRDDPFAGALALAALGWAAYGWMWDMAPGERRGINWEFVMTIVGATVIGGAELWRVIRRYRT